MSKIDDLIRELCPARVEQRKLKDLCIDFIVPMRDKPKIFSGNIPWCRIEDIQGLLLHTSLSGSYVSEDTIKEMNLKVFPTGTVICTCSASLGTYAINTQPLVTNQTFIGIVCGDLLFNRYLLYVMHTLTTKLFELSNSGTIPYVSRKKFEDLEIRIPPLLIQQEIAHILDKFTTLEAELQAELEARKKQYEHYRNKLLTPTVTDGKWFMNGNEIEWKTLGDVCSVSSGGTPSKEESSYWENGTIPWLRSEACKEQLVFHANDFITPLGLQKSSAKLFPKDTTLIALVGATKCITAFLMFESATNQNIAGIKSLNKEQLSDKYVFYYYMNLYQKLIRNLGQYDMLNLGQLRKFTIPIPPLEEQKRIVTILDKFDALVNDISSGLPAEIQARRKQYEYYRTKLLSYKNIKDVSGADDEL